MGTRACLDIQRGTHLDVTMQGMYDFYLLIMEMHGVLSDVTLKGKWLEFLSSRNIAIVLTDYGWDVVIRQGADNTIFITWLMQAFTGTVTGISIDGTDLVHPLHLGGRRIDSVFRKDFVSGLFGRTGAGFHSGSSSSDDSGSSSTESLESILNSLASGVDGSMSSSSSAIDSTENIYMPSGTLFGNNLHSASMGGHSDLWEGNSGFSNMDLLAAGIASSEELYRKKRDADRSMEKRDTRTQFHYESLVGNCQRDGMRPSVDISANERNVRMAIMTEGRNQPTTLEIPIIPGWNEVTVAYDGTRLHGMVQNWRGKRHMEAKVSGKIQRRPTGMSLGSCALHHNLKGQIDDFIMYQCIPQAIKRQLGTT